MGHDWDVGDPSQTRLIVISNYSRTQCGGLFNPIRGVYKILLPRRTQHPTLMWRFV